MRTTKPTVVCAWCTRVLSEGSRDVTHGICDSCARDVLSLAEQSWREEERRGVHVAAGHFPI